MNRTNRLTSIQRLVGLLVLMLASIVVLAPTIASAHETIIAKKPSGKAKTTLKQASLTFSGPIRRGTLKVFGPRGKASKGKGGRDPRNYSRLRAVMKRNLTPGRYTAKATWVGADGHRQRTSFKFRLVR